MVDWDCIVPEISLSICMSCNFQVYMFDCDCIVPELYSKITWHAIQRFIGRMLLLIVIFYFYYNLNINNVKFSILEWIYNTLPIFLLLFCFLFFMHFILFHFICFFCFFFFCFCFFCFCHMFLLYSIQFNNF